MLMFKISKCYKLTHFSIYKTKVWRETKTAVKREPLSAAIRTQASLRLTACENSKKLYMSVACYVFFVLLINSSKHFVL